MIMRKIYFNLLCFLFLSCQEQDKRMQPLRSISFETSGDVYQEGFSDAKDPFLFFTTSNDNMLYKYYLGKDVKETIDLKKDMNIGILGRYYVIFNKENYILNYNAVKIYNSATKVIYNLDSLTNHNGMEYSTVYNNNNSWKKNKVLLTNLFTCDLYGKESNDVMKTFITCEQLNKKKPSYSIFDFETNKVELSSITFKDVKPDTKDNTAEPWYKASTLFVGDVILYNNHFTDGVFEIDKSGKFNKAFTIKSKYTNFSSVELFKNDDIKTVFEKASNYITQVNGILYDEYRNKILVILVHGTQDIEKNGELKLSNRPFSILVYNKDYKLENEYLFDSLKHDFNNIYVCKEGLIINANNSLGNNYKPEKLIYEIFSY